MSLQKTTRYCSRCIIIPINSLGLYSYSVARYRQALKNSELHSEFFSNLLLLSREKLGTSLGILEPDDMTIQFDMGQDLDFDQGLALFQLVGPCLDRLDVCTMGRYRHGKGFIWWSIAVDFLYWRFYYIITHQLSSNHLPSSHS